MHTPDECEDIDTELRELKAEYQALRKATREKLRAISALCHSPHWTSNRRWAIADIADRGMR